MIVCAIANLDPARRGSYPRAMSEQSLAAFIKLSRCSDAVFSSVMKLDFAAYGMSAAEFPVLEVLYNRGELTPSEIGRKILRTKGNISQLAESLIRRGLVNRRRSDEDRRIMYLSLTDRGREAIAAVFPLVEKTIDCSFAVLTGEEIEHLSQLLRKLGRHAAGVGEQPDR